MVTKIFIVEDHPLMREMMKEFIDTLPDIEVCGAVRTGEEALESLAGAGANLVLIDVSLPGMSGIDLVGRVKERWPGLSCLMLTGHQEMNYVERAITAGAQGYVVKGEPFDLFDAIEQVREGREYLSESVRKKRRNSIG